MREQLKRQWHASASDNAIEEDFWAVCESQSTLNALKEGYVLVANPAKEKAATARERVGMATPPINASRREKAKLPVVLLTKLTPEFIEGLLLDVWTGHLLGDLNLRVFETRPLYVGGKESEGRGLAILHTYPQMQSSSTLTPDNLCISDNLTAAAEWVTKDCGSSLRFKFFVQQVCWDRKEISSELLPDA